MKKLLTRFLRLPGDRKWLLMEAVFFLFSAKFLLITLPLKTVLKISISQKNFNIKPDQDLLKMIRWAIYNADRLSFWKNRCLVQSLTGRWMLRRRGIPSQLSFGVTHDKNNALVAHAWLKTGDFEIVERGGDYRELYNY